MIWGLETKLKDETKSYGHDCFLEQVYQPAPKFKKSWYGTFARAATMKIRMNNWILAYCVELIVLDINLPKNRSRNLYGVSHSFSRTRTKMTV